MVFRSHSRIVAAFTLALAAGSALAQAQGFGMPRSTQQPQFGTTPQPAQPAPAPPQQGGSRTPARAQTMDRIVAVVNKDVITQRDLTSASRRSSASCARARVPAPPADVLQRQILERMITDRAQLQYARDTGMRIDDATLDRTIAAHRRAEQRMTLREFRATLERDGVAFDALPRGHPQRDPARAPARARGRADTIQVSDTEIDIFLEDQQNAPASTGAEYHLAHILVRVPEQASPEQIEQRRRAPQAGARSRRRRRGLSRRSRRAIPTRPTRCRAASSAGARTTGCPSSSRAR